MPEKSAQLPKGGVHTLGPRHAHEKSPLQLAGTVTQCATGPVCVAYSAQTWFLPVHMAQLATETHSVASTHWPV